MKRPEDMTREELEEEVAFLRSELGWSLRETDLELLVAAYPMRKSSARLVMALYRVAPRLLSVWQLDRIVEATQSEDRDPKIINVMIHFARRGMGADAIKNVWGQGYRLTPHGIALVDAALGKTPEQQRSA
jgi:DNA-binding response OmpR family regulator